MLNNNDDFEKTIRDLTTENEELKKQLDEANATLSMQQKTSESELVRRDKLLSAVNAIATMFLGAEDIEVTQKEIEEALSTLSDVVGVDRSYFWRNEKKEDGILYSSQIASWSKNGETAQFISLPFSELFVSLPQVHNDELIGIVNVRCSEIPDGAVGKKALTGMKSLLITPIMHAGDFWGFISFEDFTTERLFASEDADIISSGGIMIAAAIIRSELIESLIQAKDEAQNSAKAKSDFLARMSHEIRTPLNAVIGLTTLAQKTGDKTKAKQYLGKIGDSSYQLLNIINDVLDMSKIQSDKLEIHLAEFNLSKLINHVVNVVSVKLEEKHQTFITDIDCNNTNLIVSDELRLSQVLINLINNAIKFTPDFGKIWLSVNLEPLTDDQLLMKVMVKDSGIGISEESQSRLFTSFEQADGSITRKFGGTGLGLAISKNIISLMGGEIWIESKLGEGAAFKFNVKIGRAIDSEKMPRPENKNENKEYNWKGKKLLLVEDIEINREIVIGLLEDTEIEIVSAENGKLALDMVMNGEKFDIVLMDIQMPVMDGLEATRKIREIATPQILTMPIIAMTANAFTEDQEEALNAGLNAHVAKPLEIAVLLDTMDQYLY